MPDRSQLTQDEDAYWSCSREMIRVLIASLNRTLEDNRIGKKRRREICESYLFSVANLFDQQWFRADGQTQFPTLCYSKTFMDVDTSLDNAPTLNIPHRSVELHAMVCDEVRWFFDEQRENPSSVQVGSVGDEPMETDVVVVDHDTVTQQPCWTCKGSGDCFCVRKGKGDSTNCPRCQGTGKCRHCRGRGTA